MDRRSTGAGGSGAAPRDVVPPVAGRVPAAIDDLVDFVSRDDLPALAQAAITHAQFETIHPFVDGNGRTGRALLHAMLRAKGVSQHVSVPISAGLLTDTDGYYDALTDRLPRRRARADHRHRLARCPRWRRQREAPGLRPRRRRRPLGGPADRHPPRRGQPQADGRTAPRPGRVRAHGSRHPGHRQERAPPHRRPCRARNLGGAHRLQDPKPDLARP
ncbi:Fic family protein [Phycicoccus sp. CSK15P-2]|uniref:Fic family protein n=1 Tax=Phycicoccus sp. CSK15P-2 TaxID=2807627 RepID=UPI001EF312C6|nr:Fic family protein [Phycicoccus sp. CSK15P-2]